MKWEKRAVWLSEAYLYKPYYSTLGFSKETCPGKVILTKQGNLKPGNLIQFRIKIFNMNILQSPKLSVHVFGFMCVYEASISQVFMVFRTAVCLGPQWWTDGLWLAKLIPVVLFPQCYLQVCIAIAVYMKYLQGLLFRRVCFSIIDPG